MSHQEGHGSNVDSMVALASHSRRVEADVARHEADAWDGEARGADLEEARQRVRRRPGQPPPRRQSSGRQLHAGTRPRPVLSGCGERWRRTDGAKPKVPRIPVADDGGEELPGAAGGFGGGVVEVTNRLCCVLDSTAVGRLWIGGS